MNPGRSDVEGRSIWTRETLRSQDDTNPERAQQGERVSERC